MRAFLQYLVVNPVCEIVEAPGDSPGVQHAAPAQAGLDSVPG